MAVGTDRRAKKTASRLDQPLPLQPVRNVMSFNPPDHSAGVDGPAPEPTSVHSPTDHLDLKNNLTGPESTIQTHQHPSKKRRSSKSKIPGELRRSTSTPHMRNLALGTSGELSPTSNKARNKLGYHRTSVACGHCRRRKIRCLLAPDDPQGRCSNCIRLKKECNFFPVEHNLDTQHPSGAVKDLSTGTPTTPVASSPRHLPPHAEEKIGDFHPPYHGVSAAAPNAPYGYSGEPDIDPHHTPTSSGVQHAAYSYPPPIETQWPPTTSYLPSSTIAESPNSYWRQSPSTANSVYGSESGVSGVHTPATMSTSSTMSYGHPESHAWGQQPSFQPPPTRSMSYGNIEGLPQQYPGQGLGIQQDFGRRTSPYPYPTSIDTSQPTLHATTMGGSTSGPLSAPVLQSHQFYPPAWNSYEHNQMSPMQIPGRSMSAQWYAEPGHLDQVQEEGGPPMAYNQHGVPQYYSGA
ncbi:hypothetical protein BU25DRAFT_207228 [Macroventuria anomochaeta]|uniref:Uncharacterized protein n=1 Tax=Macroventuria anomochaeta TaxID=301207 RepID=A0ACB6RNX8_9PLEO|nr:uncharacterized protein BU25DRAFT_207228 [Macroventuria anomochaeta]KAF2622629.1 hypothetical protein BU25DRAFT_207228 [Macroventuria anomochaeta]